MRELRLQVVDVVPVLPIIRVAAELALEGADRDVGAPVVGVHDVDAHDAGGSIAHHAENVDKALVRQRVRDGERSDVVHVEPEVVVDDELDRGRGEDGSRRERREHAV